MAIWRRMGAMEDVVDPETGALICRQPSTSLEDVFDDGGTAWPWSDGDEFAKQQAAAVAHFKGASFYLDPDQAMEAPPVEAIQVSDYDQKLEDRAAALGA